MSVSGNSSGYYFSDSDEFKKAKELAEVKDENLPLFEKDASETDDYEMTNVENDNAVVDHEPESEVGGHKTEKRRSARRYRKKRGNGNTHRREKF